MFLGTVSYSGGGLTDLKMLIKPHRMTPFTFILIVLFFTNYCFFFFKLQEINYDSPRGGVSVITEKGDITTSYLLIQRAKAPDSGKYTCNPSNANPKTVVVHVLNGKSKKASTLTNTSLQFHFAITPFRPTHSANKHHHEKKNSSF